MITLAVGLVRGRPVLLRAGRTYAWLILAGALVAAGAMERGLLTHDFSMKYVADNGSRTTPTLYTFTGMWSALEGSILLWTVILAGYIAVMVVKFRRRVTDPLVGWATLITFVVSGFFFLLMVGPANPFRTISGAIPTDGPGPNPLLQNHPIVAFHPPLLYLGFVGFTIPFAFAVASLITGRLGEGWLVETRRWTLFAWGFLSIGIILGAWWSYEVLGWGGYWAWDPVENASFLPWLTATAYLHSVMVQERRGMLRLWNLSLLLATFSLTILGTFLTRSGRARVGPRLHHRPGSDRSSSGFFALVVAVTVALIAWRGDRLRSPGTIDSPISREGAFLANNLLFAAFAFVVLLGTVFPLLAEAINGQQMSVGGPYFDRMTMPIVVGLLFLMAVAPVLPVAQGVGRAAAPPPPVAGMARRPAPWCSASPSASGASTRCSPSASGPSRPPRPAANWSWPPGARAAGTARTGQRRHDRPHRRGRHRGGVRGQPFLRPPGRGDPQPGPVLQTLGGHTVTYLGVVQVNHPNRSGPVVQLRVDGGKVYRPAISQYTGGGDAGRHAVGQVHAARGPLSDPCRRSPEGG